MYFFPFHFSNIFCHKLFNQFHLFSKEMEKRGHNRSWSQCRIKTKALRSMYTKVKDSNRKSGHGRTQWTWFDRMDRLFGNQDNVDPPILEADSGDEDTPTENIDNSESHDETAVQGSVHNIFSR